MRAYPLPYPAHGARTVEVLAQAKINLRLRVLAREANGYHQLETLFLRLSLADTVRVRHTSGERTLDITGDVDLGALGPTEENLAWRAATAYLSATGQTGGFAIDIEKRIPIGGGLGGGSADAGAVLRLLDAASDSPLGETGLMAIAAMLGADVPFLTSDLPYALAWVRGERMLALEPPPQRRVLIVTPAFGVDTGEAFGWLAESRAGNSDECTTPVILDPASLSQWDSIASVASNDFEPVVVSRHPGIGTALTSLRQGRFEMAMLSGSGSSFFGIARPDSAELVAQPPEMDPAPRTWVTQTATRVESVSPIE